MYQQVGVYVYCDECVVQFQVVLCQCFVGGEDVGGFVGCVDVVDGVFYGCLYFGMVWIVVMVYGCVEVGWIDEYVVDVFDGGDCVEVGQVFQVFYLDQQVYLFVGVVQVFCYVVLV